ncbi:hypothetical protein [Halorussus marinus]|uniref:hypothetical protein n=1 Tax=Halorussus marinus TaxID=2505976 RepID=UPI00106EE943|nr:hypothetical protein [Halorussus marinus]
MVESAYVASVLATGALLVAVWVGLARTGERPRYEVGGDHDHDHERDATDGDSIAAWAAGFFGLLLAAGGVAVASVSDVSVPAAIGPAAFVGLFGALLVGYLLWGTYQSARVRGLRSSQAALLSAWLFGTLVLAAIVADLVVGW